MPVAHLVDPELASMMQILPDNDFTDIPGARVKYAALIGMMNEMQPPDPNVVKQDVVPELHVYPGAPHGFDRFAPQASISRSFYAARDAIIARVFGT